MRWLLRFLGAVILGVFIIAGITAGFALFHPRSPVPDAWHPFRPFSVTHDITPLTDFKLNRALSGEACFRALSTGASFVRLTDYQDSPQCHILDRVELRSVAGISMQPVETRCQTALRLAMWAEHGLRPAAERHFGQEVQRIRHAASYSCRAIRTTSGASTRMSTHARAEAIDINGLDLADGSRLTLLDGWAASDVRADFFRDLRDSACMWFRVTLGPDFNALHADHFHMQHSGWGLCR